MTERSKNNFWRIGPFVGYGVFVLAVLALVLYASIQQVELVEDHPYEKGLAYQTRIDRLEQTASLDSSIVIEPRSETQALAVRFAGVDRRLSLSGEIRLLRPSNVWLDRHWSIVVDSTGTQDISLAGLASGLWRIEIDWKVDTVAYYYQSKLIIP